MELTNLQCDQMNEEATTWCTSKAGRGVVERAILTELQKTTKQAWGEEPVSALCYLSATKCCLWTSTLYTTQELVRDAELRPLPQNE